jgi:hypothetical protein
MSFHGHDGGLGTGSEALETGCDFCKASTTFYEGVKLSAKPKTSKRTAKCQDLRLLRMLGHPSSRRRRPSRSRLNLSSTPTLSILVACFRLPSLPTVLLNRSYLYFQPSFQPIKSSHRHIQGDSAFLAGNCATRKLQAYSSLRVSHRVIK